MVLIKSLVNSQGLAGPSPCNSSPNPLAGGHDHVIITNCFQRIQPRQTSLISPALICLLVGWYNGRCIEKFAFKQATHETRMPPAQCLHRPSLTLGALTCARPTAFAPFCCLCASDPWRYEAITISCTAYWFKTGCFAIQNH